MLSVYVAGAIAELGRCQAAIASVRRHVGPDAITYDWAADVAAARERGVADGSLSHEDRAQIASVNLEAIIRADVVWLLASRLGTDSWVELGVALGIRAFGSALVERPSSPWIIASGVDLYRSLNCDIVNARETRDEDALQQVIARCRRGE